MDEDWKKLADSSSGRFKNVLILMCGVSPILVALCRRLSGAPVNKQIVFQVSYSANWIKNITNQE